MIPDKYVEWFGCLCGNNFPYDAREKEIQCEGCKKYYDLKGEYSDWGTTEECQEHLFPEFGGY